MAWQTRNERAYYYRTAREGRRVRRVYVGTGPAAELAAARDATSRAEYRALREAARDELASLAEADALLDDFVRLTESLARAALMATGFFRHARGAWRRRRTMKTQIPPLAAVRQNPALPPEQEQQEQQACDQIEELVRKAEGGDEGVMPQLVRVLDRAPSLWKRYAELGALAEITWPRQIAGDNNVLLEALRRELQELKAGVAAEGLSPLEKLLVGRVGACWLQVHQADIACGTLTRAELPEHAALLRRQNAAHKRFLQSIKTLATVRRLFRPPPSPVQVATRLGAGEPAKARRSSPPSAAAEMALN